MRPKVNHDVAQVPISVNHFVIQGVKVLCIVDATREAN